MFSVLFFTQTLKFLPLNHRLSADKQHSEGEYVQADLFEEKANITSCK